jgi:hypothetical protein
MNLQDFIHETLVQIVRGVETAQAEFPERNAQFNPHPDFSRLPAGTTIATGGDASPAPVQVVDFDVAVTAEASSKNGANASIGIYAAKAGIFSSRDAKDSTVSRVRFSVPIMLTRHGIRPVQSQISDM